MKLTFVHLYPNVLNLYGDRGNVITLRQRCLWRGIGFETVAVGLGDTYCGDGDLLFIGGDQDREQQVVAADLRERKGGGIRDAVERGIPLLAVCGGYQLLQRVYRPAAGPDLTGLGLFDAETVHPGIQSPRRVGNLAIEWRHGTLVGFENHGGRTYLGPGVAPLGSVLVGSGNNGEDGLEGAVYRNVYGTYMHGSLLPKNPALADHLLALALRIKYGDPVLTSSSSKQPGPSSGSQVEDIASMLPPLDDTLEQRAHDAALRQALAGSRSRRAFVRWPALRSSRAH